MNKNVARRALTAIIATAMIPCGAIAAENTIVFDTIGGWVIKTDLDRDYRCYLEADYDNGAAVRAGFNSDDGRFYISVGQYEWDWAESGNEYTVELGFDDDPARELSATGIVLETEYVQSGVRLQVPAEQEQDVIAAFMYRSLMHLSWSEEHSLTLGLYGTQRATEALETCQASMARAAGSSELSAVR